MKTKGTIGAAQEALLAEIVLSAYELRDTRRANVSYALEQSTLGMMPCAHPALKQAENRFWKACHALLRDERTGGWRG